MFGKFIAVPKNVSELAKYNSLKYNWRIADCFSCLMSMNEYSPYCCCFWWWWSYGEGKMGKKAEKEDVKYSIFFKKNCKWNETNGMDVKYLHAVEWIIWY